MLDWPQVPGRVRAHLWCSGGGRVSISHLWAPHLAHLHLHGRWLRGGHGRSAEDDGSAVCWVGLLSPMLSRAANRRGLDFVFPPTTPPHRPSPPPDTRTPPCHSAAHITTTRQNRAQGEGTRTTSLIFLVALLSAVGVALVALRLRLGSILHARTRGV